jgi:O-antigen/teichoic acid export membrane protein
VSKGVRLAGALGVHDAGRALRDFATYLPTQAIPALAGFLVLPVLARKLAPTELGVLAICQTLVTLGWTIIASWLAVAIIRELPAHRVRGDLTGFARALRRSLLGVAAAFAVFTGVVFGVGQLTSAVGDNALLVVAATAGLVLQNIAVSVFAASLRPRAYAVVDVSARLGGAGLGVGLVFAGYKVEGYLAGLAVASLAIGAIGVVAGWPRGGTDSNVSIGPWLRYGIPASAGAIATWFLAFVDRYILAFLKDAGSVGVYTVSSVIGDRAVAIPVMAFFTAAAPLLVTAYEKHGRDEVERLMTAYTRIALLIGLPCIAFVAVAASDLVWILTGKYDYARDAGVAPIVAGGAFLFALAFVAGTGLVIAKRTRPLIAASGIALVVNVGLNFALIPPFGLKGAAAATPVSMAVYLAGVYWSARRHARWQFPVATLARASAAAIAGSLVAIEAMPDHGWRPWAVLIAAVTGLPTYALVLVLLGERHGLRPGLLRRSG